MNLVLAALDASPFAPTVLATAVGVGRLTGAAVEAIHVRADPDEPVDVIGSVADRAGVRLRIVDGDPGRALIDTLRGHGTIALVIGGRARSRPAAPRTWHVARAVLEQTNAPVIVVPSGSDAHDEIRRLLVPLEGSDVSSRSVLEQLVPLVASDVELEVLHVFTVATVPTMLDQPAYDLDTLGREFLRRHFPHPCSIEFRGGGVVEQVTRVAVEHHMDLIALSWSQSPSPLHARVIRGVLDDSTLPVLLLTVLPPGATAAGADPGGGAIVAGDA